MTNDFMDYSGWTFENVFKNDVNAFSDCGDHKLVGGFSKFGKDAVAKKEYTFPPHTKVRVKV